MFLYRRAKCKQKCVYSLMLNNLFLIFYLAAPKCIKSPSGPGYIRPAIKRPLAPPKDHDAQTEVRKKKTFIVLLLLFF